MLLGCLARSKHSVDVSCCNDDDNNDIVIIIRMTVLLVIASSEAPSFKQLFLISSKQICFPPPSSYPEMLC